MENLRNAFGTVIGLVMSILFALGTSALVLSLAADKLPALEGIGNSLRCMIGIPAADSQCVLDQVNNLKRERQIVADERDKLAHEMAAHQERQRQLAAMGEKVTNYSQFQSAKLPFGEVTTGTEFSSVLRPEDWTTSWCYLRRKVGGGFVRQLDLGRREAGKPVHWYRFSDEQIRDADWTREQVEAASASCKFPEG